MKRLFIDQIKPQETSIRLKGWVYQYRALSKVCFIVLKDTSGEVQCVAQPSQIPEGLKVEDTVEILGKVKIEAKAKKGFEIIIENIQVLNPSSKDLPFNTNSRDINLVSQEVLVAHRPLSLRHPEINEVFRLQTEIVHEFRDFLRSNKFQEIITSKIVSSGTEGGSNLFQLKYFEKIAYLAQSPQFYKEYGVAGFERVFETGHVYRAEPHASTRHLTEYYSLDVEMGFIDSVHEVIELERQLLTQMFKNLNIKFKEVLERRNLPMLPDMSTVPTWSFKECLEKLKVHFNRTDLHDDLDGEAEKQLCNLAEQENGVPAVFVLGFPQSSRPFYCHPLNDKGEAASFDLLFRGLEITSGGQRLHNKQEIEKSLKKKRLNPEDFSDHLKMYELGMPPHGGFAIGLERLTALILGLPNVKQASMYPRDRDKLTP